MKKGIKEIMDEVFEKTAMPPRRTPFVYAENEFGLIEVYDADGNGVAMMGKATFEKMRAMK